MARDESITVHDAMPFSREFRVEDASALKLSTKAMLMFVAPGTSEDLLKDGTAWKDRFNKILYGIGDLLDPKGTIIAHVPQPYFDHATRIAGECACMYVLCFSPCTGVQDFLHSLCSGRRQLHLSFSFRPAFERKLKSCVFVVVRLRFVSILPCVVPDIHRPVSRYTFVLRSLAFAV